VPGWVFVSDVWDRELIGAMAGLGFMLRDPPVPGLFAFLIPPPAASDRATFRAFLAPVLEALHGPWEANADKWDSLSVVFIPTDIATVEIAGVLDLRQRAAQQWLYHFFEHGDGAVFVRRPPSFMNPAPARARDFLSMLPALVYPNYGGSGFTKSLGSWLRSVDVHALIFPSARSDAAVTFDGAERLVAFHGWNMVDYRGLDYVPDRQVHFDFNEWYDFVAGRQEAPTLATDGDSWAIRGAERRYAATRDVVLGLLNSPATRRATLGSRSRESF
jgi:hypothetical protein